MKKINIVGSSGSGKTTFGRKLSKIINIEYYEIDSLFWKANWTKTENKEFRKKIEDITNLEEWILDGNYQKLNDLKLERADTVIWLNTSFIMTLIQSLKRAFVRITSKKELWEGTGNRETIKKTFFSKDSILLWMVSNFFKMRKRYEKIIETNIYDHIDFIILKNRKEKEEFLKRIKLN